VAEKKGHLLYAATYSSLEDALADLDAVERAYEDLLLGWYDAAVIANRNGKLHVARRLDRPHVRVIPERFGGGSLPRKELREAAAHLASDEAGLIVVGEQTIEKGLDMVVTRAGRVAKHTLHGTTDEISNELQEALKS
jgi:hypothetical protein